MVLERKKSTTVALIYPINKIVEGTVSTEIVGAVFRDLTKASDRLTHNLLISKIKFYNFDKNSVKLISYYLTNRKQFVSINNKKLKYERNKLWRAPKVSAQIHILIYINYLSVDRNTFRR